MKLKNLFPGVIASFVFYQSGCMPGSSGDSESTSSSSSSYSASSLSNNTSQLLGDYGSACPNTSVGQYWGDPDYVFSTGTFHVSGAPGPAGNQYRASKTHYVVNFPADQTIRFTVYPDQPNNNGYCKNVVNCPEGSPNRKVDYNAVANYNCAKYKVTAYRSTIPNLSGEPEIIDCAPGVVSCISLAGMTQIASFTTPLLNNGNGACNYPENSYSSYSNEIMVPGGTASVYFRIQAIGTDNGCPHNMSCAMDGIPVSHQIGAAVDFCS